METKTNRLRPLVAIIALAFATGAANNCEPNTLPGDLGEGPVQEAPANTWSWVDVNGAVCADGSPTGMGVNPGSSDTLLIYLQGGGGCWNRNSCVDTPLSTHLDGYGLPEFGNSQLMLSQGPFARGDAANPFRDANMVYVPYCTGDAHAGDAITDYDGVDIHHKGHANMTRFLSRIVATFPNVNKVVLAGSSAGGIGAVFNAARTQDAFGSTPVHVISDSGILLPGMDEAQLQALRSAWDLDATMPADCDGCLSDLSKLYPYVASSNPRVGLISMSRDLAGLVYSGTTPEEYEQGLMALAPTIDALPNVHYFVDTGYGHVMLNGSWHTTMAGSESLSAWTGKLANDDPAWTSVTD